ncbi:MAG: protein kinase, partial [Deltaproteobacteria bacterium]|nr:protein kinase [Deltaproteobacteria bacterium]
MEQTIIVCAICKTQNSLNADTCTNCGEPVAVAKADNLIGSLFNDKYKIERKLGVGGMGTVYLASQQPLNRSCVLKLLNKDVLSDPANSKRFKREAEMSSKIWHPNAVQIYDFDNAKPGPGEDEGAPFIAMEFIGGSPLSKIIKSDFPFEDSRIIRIFTQLCDVLAAGHKLGIVHRDLKPDNIMVLDLPTEKDFVKLLDFGLAKFAEPGEDQAEITQAGWALGTPKYMAPEQCRGQAISAQTDVYALGVLLYYMLAGVLPFEGESVAALMVKHTMEKPVPPSRRSRSDAINPELERIALWAMEKKLDARLPSAKEFKRSLDRINESKKISGVDTGAFGTIGDLIGDTAGILAVDGGTESREAIVAVVDLVSEEVPDSPEAIMSCVAKASDVFMEYDVRPERAGELRLRVGFGFDGIHGDEAEKAIRACRQLMSALPFASVAIHGGIVEVRGGALQSCAVVDLAERLALAAPAGQILVTEDGGRNTNIPGLRAIAPYRYKGERKPIRLYELDLRVDLDKVDETATTAPNPIQEEDWQLVGRDELMHRLVGFADDAANRKGRAALMCGTSGMGKTRCLKELRSARPKMRWVLVSARSRDALKKLFTDLGQENFKREHQHIVQWAMGELNDGYIDLGPDELVRGALVALRECVESLIKRAPLGILIDDIDSGDALLRATSQGIIEDSTRLGTLVLMTSRPLRTTPQGMTRIDIPALLLDDCYKLSNAIDPDNSIPAHLMRVAGGVPAAVVHLAHASKEGLIKEDSQFETTSDGSRLRPVYEAWLDAVPKNVRASLGVTAALGDLVDPDVLEKVAQAIVPTPALTNELVHRGMLVRDPASSRVRFSSKLEAEVAYARLSRGHRSTVHRQAALVLAQKGTDPDIVAKHFEDAGDKSEALEKYREATVVYAERKDRPRLIACYRKACELATDVPGEDNRFIEDALALIPMLLEAGKVGDVEVLILNAEKAAQAVGDPRFAVQVTAQRIQMMISQNLFQEAGPILNDALAKARELRDGTLLSDLLAQAAEVAERDGRVDAAIKYLSTALELAGRVDNQRSRNQAVGHLGSLGRILFRASQFEKAQATFRQQQDAARKIKNRMEEGRALVNEAAVLQSREQYDSALERLRIGLDVSRSVGDLLTVSKAQHNTAHIYARRGDNSLAKKGFEESLQTARSIRWREGVAMNH